jgi:hypothetical protein
MKLFKSVDDKLLEIGFEKTREDKYGATYNKNNSENGFIHRVEIVRKSSGEHILHSYDPTLFDTKKIGNTCVGLTAYEMELFVKKMKQIGLHSK